MGLDIVAGISMSAALAFGETLAAAVVGLMYAGGQLLENFAANRAQSHMRALLARVPKTALRYDDGHLSEVAIDMVRTGDRLLSPPGRHRAGRWHGQIRQGAARPRRPDRRISAGAAN